KKPEKRHLGVSQPEVRAPRCKASIVEAERPTRQKWLGAAPIKDKSQESHRGRRPGMGAAESVQRLLA
ncbi:MAG: hypothetical protein VW579_04355, partial [Verrucomicrobiales bacterium]